MRQLRKEVVTILFFALLGGATAFYDPATASRPCPTSGTVTVTNSTIHTFNIAFPLSKLITRSTRVGAGESSCGTRMLNSGQDFALPCCWGYRWGTEYCWGCDEDEFVCEGTCVWCSCANKAYYCLLGGYCYAYTSSCYGWTWPLCMPCPPWC